MKMSKQKTDTPICDELVSQIDELQGQREGKERTAKRLYDRAMKIAHTSDENIVRKRNLLQQAQAILDEQKELDAQAQKLIAEAKSRACDL